MRISNFRDYSLTSQRVSLPFCHSDRTELNTTTWTFERMVTRVKLLQIGWKQGEEWDKAYGYLAIGNVQLLDTLHPLIEPRGGTPNQMLKNSKPFAH
jgi:hypothetical protein